MNWHHRSSSSLLAAEPVEQSMPEDVGVPIPAPDSSSADSWAQLGTRLRNDLRMTTICLCGVLTVVTITPFAFYRLINQQWSAAIIDFLIVLFIAGISGYAWRTGRSGGPAVAMVALSSISCVVAASLLGLAGALWIYTTMIMNFFLVARRYALLVNASLIASITLFFDVFAQPVEVYSFAATGALVCLFSTLFASRTEQQHQQLRALASLDPLTSAGNRRLMEADLHTTACAKHGNLGKAVAILDLDHFKRVNDRFGHEAGDCVLIDFAHIVRSTLRRGDRLYRYGGEEFVLLLSDLGRSDLETVLNKLRERIGLRLRSPGGPVTVSIGVALLHQGEDWTAWLGRADGALYTAKREGRDRIVIDGF